MKISLTTESGGYDVVNIDEIENGAIYIKKIVDELSACGDDIKASVDIANADFDTANYDRVYSAIDSYKKRLANFNDEIVELIQSVNAYQEDKHDRWDWD